MKTFEEKFTAWVDGELAGDELAAFETELANMHDAEADKLAAHQLGDLLREHGCAPELANADFFNHQLMQRIEAETSEPKVAPERRAFSWSLARLAWAGACSLAVAFALFWFVIPTAPQAAPEPAVAAAQISAHSDDPAITATAFQSKKNHVTVLWLDGLDYMPENYALK
jgi:negative regulator of sigma E activity